LRFIWDDQNTAHLATHGIDPETAEAVFFEEDRMVQESTRGLGRYECEATHQGRLYRLIFTAVEEDAIYPIACFRIRKWRGR